MNAASPASTQHTTQGTHPAGLHCLSCHYNLTNVPFGPCPECGLIHDPHLARRLRHLARWTRSAQSNDFTPEVVLLAVAAIFPIIACGAFPPILILVPIAIAPFITLILGTIALRLAPAPLRPLHRAMWTQYNIRLWDPALSWCIIPPLLLIPPPLEGTGLFVFFIALVGVVIVLLLSVNAWSIWNKRVQRVASLLRVPGSIWPARVGWIPTCVHIIAVLVALIPVLLAATVALFR